MWGGGWSGRCGIPGGGPRILWGDKSTAIKGGGALGGVSLVGASIARSEGFSKILSSGNDGEGKGSVMAILSTCLPTGDTGEGHTTLLLVLSEASGSSPSLCPTSGSSRGTSGADCSSTHTGGPRISAFSSIPSLTSLTILIDSATDPTGLMGFLLPTGEGVEMLTALVAPHVEGVVLPECMGTLDWRGLSAGVVWLGELSLLLSLSALGKAVFRAWAYEKVLETTVEEKARPTSLVKEELTFSPSI